MSDPLYLLDGYSIIYRSYFAFIRNPLRNPRGENSSAVFGFVRTLLSIFREYEPKSFAVVMDSRTPTFRHERYPEYKATRDKTPDDLHAQIPVIEALLERLNVPVARLDGYEADDVMATLATRCRDAGRACRIISGDKDLLQLVGEEVRVLRPGRDGIAELDRDAIKEDWGVYPEQILDYLSLVGDTSDNVPGVKGIGAKTAAEMLSEFGSLDALYERLDEISSKSRRGKLEEGRDSAMLSRELITLATDAPLDAEIDSFAVDGLDFAAAAPILLDQGMRSVVQEAGLDPEAFSAERVEGGEMGEVEPSSGHRREDSAGDEAGTAAAGDGAAAAGGASRADSLALPDSSEAESAEEARRLALAGAKERAAAVLSQQERAAFAARGTYELVDSLEALDRWIDAARAAGTVAFDSETDSLSPVDATPVGFSLAVEPGAACYIALEGPDGTVLAADAVRERLKALLEDPAIRVVGQNLKYDYAVLERWGVTIANVAFDTMIAAWLVDTTANGFGMDRVAEDYLDYRTVHFAELFGEKGNAKVEGRSFAEVPLEKAADYAAEDADITLRLFVVLDRLVDKRGVRKILEELELPLIPILARMELEGIGLDVGELKRYSVELGERIAATERSIYEEVGHEFNIGSTRQLQQILFEERKLQPIKKTKTGYSTDESVLQELAREDRVPDLVLQYRRLTKLRSTYVDTLPTMVNPTTGRIHTSFNQCGTATGRISSNDPNLQNIPIKDEEGRRIRMAFVPREGWTFVSADYAQIELVILAHLSQDEALCSAFREGEDVHRRTAGLIFGMDPADISSEQRRIAKTINFGVMYGMSAFRLSNELGIPRKDADAFITAYFGTYSGIRRFIDETVARAERDGEIRTLLGRPRPLPDITNRNRTVKSAAERVAVNTPIQGTGADIVKQAMINLGARLKKDNLRARLILQVHDELMFECPHGEVERLEALVMEEMSGAVALSVPLRVSVEHGTRWGDMHA